MQAIYKVEFRSKEQPDILMDERRYSAPASTVGFKKIVAHAIKVCCEDEFVASVEMITWERR